jgi:hypothetical protein
MAELASTGAEFLKDSIRMPMFILMKYTLAADNIFPGMEDQC